MSHVPRDDDLIEWLALMQHHGAPTRLLDCTYSFPVAAYFAARDARSEFFAVWGFNWRHLMPSVSERFGLDDKVKSSSYDFHINMHHKANDFLNRKASGALVFPVDPMRQNERRAAQQGLFLFPGDPARTFLENLACLFPESGIERAEEGRNEIPFDASQHNSRQITRLKVVKLILPAKSRLETLMALNRMNIHEASLFPGLDGFARSLSSYTYYDD
jgi:hypothetical protein